MRDQINFQIGLVILILLTNNLHGAAQSILWHESFESDGEGIRYWSSNSFNDSPNDHFQRTNGSDISNVSGSYVGMNGNYFWAAEDTDDNGGDGLDEKTITFNTIQTAGYDSLTFSGKFAAGNENGPGASNYDSSDHIHLEYSVDGGVTWNPGIWFSYEDHGDNSNEPIGLDQDFSGSSDVNGTNRLGTSFAEFYFTITGQHDSIVLRLEIHAESSSEELAFDDLKVMGTPIIQQPQVFEQAIIDQLDSTYFYSFDSTSLGFGLGRFGGAGFGIPSVGQLASGTFQISGFSDGPSQFGAEYHNGDFARGLWQSSDTMAGVYASHDSSANPVNTWLTLVGADGEMNPGSLTIRIKNGTNSMIRHVMIGFIIKEFNSSGSSERIRFYQSNDGTIFNRVSSADHFTQPTIEATPNWIDTPKLARFNTEIIPGGDLYIRLLITKVNTAWGRDIIGLDDLSFKFQNQPVCPCSY